MASVQDRMLSKNKTVPPLCLQFRGEHEVERWVWHLILTAANLLIVPCFSSRIVQQATPVNAHEITPPGPRLAFLAWSDLDTRGHCPPFSYCWEKWITTSGLDSIPIEVSVWSPVMSTEIFFTTQLTKPIRTSDLYVYTWIFSNI